MDAGNGAWSKLAPRIFEELGIRAHRLYCDLDGASHETVRRIALALRRWEP